MSLICYYIHTIKILIKRFIAHIEKMKKECKYNLFSLTKIIFSESCFFFLKASNYCNLNVYRTSVNKIKIWGVLEIFNTRL